MAKGKDQSEWKKKMYDIIFKSDTFYGKLFDEVLLVVILISVGVVMLESIPEVRLTHGTTLFTAEWVFTILFLAEYILRIVCSPKPQKYIFSFFGIVDLLAILPTFIAIAVPAVQPLIVIRALRVYCIFKRYWVTASLPYPPELCRQRLPSAGAIKYRPEYAPTARSRSTKGMPISARAVAVNSTRGSRATPPSSFQNQSRRCAQSPPVAISHTLGFSKGTF